MTFPASSEDIYETAKTIDKQVRIVGQRIKAIKDNTEVNYIIDAYKHCVTAMNYFNSLTVDMTKVGDAIALQFGNDNYSAYASSYLALKDTLLPAFIAKVGNNFGLIQDQINVNPSTGDKTYGSLAQAARDSVLTDVDAILAEYDEYN